MVNVIFVCMGNICRSPSGEGVFKSLVRDAGLENAFFIDSAGIYSYHAGEPADSRMRKHASKRGYDLTSISRQLSHGDLKKFDYIIAMDSDNYRDILRLDRNGEFEDKVFMMNDFSAVHTGSDVPDPYYGGPQGFEIVLDMLEESCRGLLDSIRGKNGL